MSKNKDKSPSPKPGLKKEYQQDEDAFKKKYDVDKGSPPPETNDPHSPKKVN